MTLDEKIQKMRQRRLTCVPRRSKVWSEMRLARIEQGLDELRGLHRRIRRCMQRYGKDQPWYLGVWRSVAGLFVKEEEPEQLYEMQQRSFNMIRTELDVLHDVTSEERQRFEALYGQVREQKLESEDTLSTILDDLVQKKDAYLTAGGQQYDYAGQDKDAKQDRDALARRIADLEYQAQTKKDLTGILERRRMFLHEICMQYVEVTHAYARLCQQAAAFEQESICLRDACQNFTTSNRAAEYLFGSLDTFIVHIRDLRQAYQDSRQTSATYCQELLEETESSQRFQERD